MTEPTVTKEVGVPLTEVFNLDLPDEWNHNYYPFPKRDAETVAQYL